MGAPFTTSNKALEVVDTLRDVLRASVWLIDVEKRVVHVRMPSRWLSMPYADFDRERANGCHCEARIGDRWRLLARRVERLHPDARALVAWAAELLAKQLPAAADRGLEYAPGRGGGGGTSGSAESGIPVWWARKTRA